MRRRDALESGKLKVDGDIVHMRHDRDGSYRPAVFATRAPLRQSEDERRVAPLSPISISDSSPPSSLSHPDRLLCRVDRHAEVLGQRTTAWEDHAAQPAARSSLAHELPRSVPQVGPLQSASVRSHLPESRLPVRAVEAAPRIE
jgi:hypothetical protein